LRSVRAVVAPLGRQPHQVPSRLRQPGCGGALAVGAGGLLQAGGVFAPLRGSRRLFQQVRVNRETQTVQWPGEVDLDPNVLYGRHEPASGVQIERRIVREPSSAAHT
jgi:hypothetical protein